MNRSRKLKIAALVFGLSGIIASTCYASLISAQENAKKMKCVELSDFSVTFAINPIKYPVPLDKRALVYVAHPDDETIGLGGKIVSLAKRGWRVKVVIATDDPRKGHSGQLNSTIRRRECLTAMKIAGVSDVVFLGLKEETLSSKIPFLIDETKKLLWKFKPSQVFTHAWEGGNVDHDAIHFIVVQALRSSGAIGYEFPEYSYKYDPFHPETAQQFPEQGKMIVKQSFDDSTLMTVEAMRRCYETERHTLSRFQNGEKYRLIDKNKALKRHPGLYYEGYARSKAIELYDKIGV